MKNTSENRKTNLADTLKIIIDNSFEPYPEFYPSIDFIKNETSINNLTDRNYYLWILCYCDPIKENDFEVFNYLITSLSEYDSVYYKYLKDEIMNIKNQI